MIRFESDAFAFPIGNDALSDTNAVAHWRKAGEAVTHEEAKLAVERVHTAGHLQEVQRMSQRGGGFDTDTYCAPGSWDAMLDGTSAWLVGWTWP